MSITKLTSSNHEEVIRLFRSEIENYYFLINDLVVNNYQGEHFKVFGEYQNGELVSILLNNYNNVTYYSPVNDVLQCPKFDVAICPETDGFSVHNEGEAALCFPNDFTNQLDTSHFS